MLRHVVMISLHEEAERPLSERLHELEQGLRQLPAAVDEIRHLEVGRDVVGGARSAHIALIVDVDDLEALGRYRDHPAHRRLVEELIQPTLERISAVDFLRE